MQNKELTNYFGEDKNLYFFFEKWLKNGLNAKKAYLSLHPNVSEHSAETLGSRMLRKVEIPLILNAFGLGIEEYMIQLKSGLEATKIDPTTGETVPDHKTRLHYHTKLGKLLGLETENPTVQFNNQQNNQFMSLSEFMTEMQKRRKANASF